MPDSHDERPLPPEIRELKDRMEKDPRSRLFINLADAYVKGGMIEDAISVLKRGLEVYPQYVSPRVSLGKLYLQQGMISEAREEFEKVIEIIPDNLVVHKKLAAIYKTLGLWEEAMKSCLLVLDFNQQDEEMRALLKEVEGRESHEAGKEEVPEELLTSSVAALYLSQGYHEKGLAIYRRLMERDPANHEIRRKFFSALLTVPAHISAPYRRAEVVRRLRRWRENIKQDQSRRSQ